MGSRKGIILAGGTGSRLWPITNAVSKQLLPVYDKPMIYYPLSSLMLAGINEIAIITTANDQAQFQSLLGSGSQWGLKFTYLVQSRPAGIAQAFTLAADFINDNPVALILGDNIFFGHGLTEKLKQTSDSSSPATLFAQRVANPTRYGVVELDCSKAVKSIEEKPIDPKSNLAITGIYFFDKTVADRARRLKPSVRGELEIVDVLTLYLKDKQLNTEILGRGFAWFDTGTNESLIDAGIFVRNLQQNQGLLVGSPDEIAFRNGWISWSEFQDRARLYRKSVYGKQLAEVHRT